MNAIGTQLSDLINSGLTLSMMAVGGVEGGRRGKREGEESVSKRQIQPGCGE